MAGLRPWAWRWESRQRRAVGPASGLKAVLRYSVDLVNSANKRKAASEQVSELTTNRLSVYLRCLNQLEAAGVDTISSQALAEQFHLNAAQIRKDLAYFGEFGVRGVGYYVKDLKRHLRQILGLDRKLRVAVLGAGNLGLALADYQGFRREGFKVILACDNFQAAVNSYNRNSKEKVARLVDLTTATAGDLIALMGETAPGSVPAGVIGGPPCQGFSLPCGRTWKLPGAASGLWTVACGSSLRAALIPG